MTDRHHPIGSPAAEPGAEPTENMEDLLEGEALAHPQLRRGAIIEGVVLGSDRDGMLVDIGAKSEGVIPPNEMQSLRPEGAAAVSPGDKVLVFVLQPETPEGQIIVSLDRARGEKGWRVLQQYYEEGTTFEGEVAGFNKGGLLVDVEGVHAFVPLSQLAGARFGRSADEAGEKGLASWVGKTLRVKVIEINRRRNRVILSERAAMQEWRAQQKERLLAELREGEIQRGKITSIRDFGIFVDLGGADGLVHLSELSWDRGKSPEEMFQVGDEVDVYILKIDQENKKIALSLRRAQPEQWEGLIDKYEVGQMVTGQVTKLAPFGAFARIEGPLEGLIHISELVDRRVTHPHEVVKEGEILPLKIVRIERHRHRLGLSLKQARPQAEEMGYIFDENGSVLALPGQEGVQRLQAEGAVAPDEESTAALGAQLTPELREQLAAEVAGEPEVEEAEEAPEEAEAEAIEEAPEEAEAEAIEEAPEEAEVEASEEAPEEAEAEETEEAPEETEAEETEEAPEEAEAQASEEAPEEAEAEEAEEAPEETEAEASEEAPEEAEAQASEEAPEEAEVEEAEEAPEEAEAEASEEAPEEAEAEASEEAPEEAEAAPPADVVPEEASEK
jgi:small subunit ribosomal protein S1